MRVLFACLIAWSVWSFFDDFVAPQFLDSRIERIREKDLPTACVEKGGIIYCRMKADDFRFPIPPGSHVQGPIILSGGRDTVDGSLQVLFANSNQMPTVYYEAWVSSRLPLGGDVKSEPIPGGLAIQFHYFGDN